MLYIRVCFLMLAAWERPESGALLQGEKQQEQDEEEVEEEASLMFCIRLRRYLMLDAWRQHRPESVALS